MLYFASQLGKKMSKFSFFESEYFLAIKVIGQNILKRSRIKPSPTTNPIEIQVKGVILPDIPEKYDVENNKNKK